MPSTGARMRRHSAIGALVLGVVLLTAGLLSFSAGRASETATPETHLQVVEVDSSIPDTPEGRARFGTIFLGTVLREIGREELPASDGGLIKVLYEVEVEQSLKGDARGVVRISYNSLELLPPDTRKAATLHPGDRALFFAGYNPEQDWYPVSANGRLHRVANDQEAAELIAFYEPLIRDAERNQRQPAAPDPCETPNRDPEATLSATRGKAGEEIHLTGGPFARAEVAVSWDDPRGEVIGVPVGEDCQADGVVVVPDLPAGEYELVVQDALDRKVRVGFAVVGGE